MRKKIQFKLPLGEFEANESSSLTAAQQGHPLALSHHDELYSVWHEQTLLPAHHESQDQPSIS